MILENLRTSGVQQPNKGDKIEFESITGWPGEYICAEGQYTEGETEKRAGIFVGPEFGTVGQPDLTAAAREAGQARFDVLIACAFSYDAHATELNQLRGTADTQGTDERGPPHVRRPEEHRTG